MFLLVSVILSMGGGCYPSMPCNRSPGGLFAGGCLLAGGSILARGSPYQEGLLAGGG